MYCMLVLPMMFSPHASSLIRYEGEVLPWQCLVPWNMGIIKYTRVVEVRGAAVRCPRGLAASADGVVASDIRAAITSDERYTLDKKRHQLAL